MNVYGQHPKPHSNAAIYVQKIKKAMQFYSNRNSFEQEGDRKKTCKHCIHRNLYSKQQCQ